MKKRGYDDTMNNVQSSIIGGKSGGKRRVLFGKDVLSLPLRHEPFALPCWVHALYLRKNAKRSDEWYRAKLRFMAQPGKAITNLLYTL